MDSSFNDMGISQPILMAIGEMGFEEPTEVQSKAIPHVMNKEDVIVKSKTGSGKTAVFGIPMLQMTDPAAAGPQGLILTPTRELAVQVDNDISLMSKHLKHQTTAVYGQHSMSLEVKSLNKGITIVTGTPGRVFDHIRHGILATKNINFLVLDEADRMLDMGFIDQVERIIRVLPKNRVTMLFSATIPAGINKICRNYLKNPVTIEIESQTKTVDTIQQIYYRVAKNEKRMWLNRLLLVEHPENCLIFCNTRIGVNQVQKFLSQKGYASQSLHGDIPQGKRLRTMQQFKQGKFHLLVATDVAARGIHVDDLSMVINYDVPEEKDSYVHRVGRTGRAGNGGRAITLVTSDDVMSLYEIEEHIGVMIQEGELPSEALFIENKAESKKWIQANTNTKQHTQQTANTKHPYAGRSRNYAGRSRNYAGQSRNHEKQSQILCRQSPSRDSRQFSPHDRQSQLHNRHSDLSAKPSPNNAEMQLSKPHAASLQTKSAAKTVRNTTKSVRPPSNVTMSQIKERMVNVEKKVPAAEKPLLKRLIGRILGK